MSPERHLDARRLLVETPVLEEGQAAREATLWGREFAVYFSIEEILRFTVVPAILVRLSIRHLKSLPPDVEGIVKPFKELLGEPHGAYTADTTWTTLQGDAQPGTDRGFLWNLAKPRLAELQNQLRTLNPPQPDQAATH